MRECVGVAISRGERQGDAFKKKERQGDVVGDERPGRDNDEEKASLNVVSLEYYEY
jgi:hypothetical protein